MTLVEVVIAAMVLVVAIFGLVSTMVYTMRADAETHEANIALAAMRAKIDEVRSRPFNDVFTIYSQDQNRHFGIPGLKPAVSDADIYDPHRSGEVIVAVLSGNLIRVTVRAEWSGPMGQRLLEMTTELTDRRKEF